MLPEESIKALDSAKQKILDAEARGRFRPGTRDWKRAMNAARALLGLREEDTGHLAEFISLSNKKTPYTVCITCGLPVSKEHQTVTEGPKEILDKAADHNPLLRGLYRSVGLWTVREKVPIQNLQLVNGFCEICQGSRRIPTRFRIGDFRAPDPLTFRTNSVEEAILFLRHNHVIFDEDRFRIAWKRSIQIGI